MIGVRTCASTIGVLLLGVAAAGAQAPVQGQVAIVITGIRRAPPR